MRILIPLISAFLFSFGGQEQVEKLKPFNQKLWRWLIGLPIGLLFLNTKLVVISNWLVVGLVTLTYFLATNLFGYGDKSILNKFLSQPMTHLASGAIFGLASFPLIGWWVIPQTLISGGVFYLVEVKKINNPWAELLRGGLGSCLL